MTEGARQLKAWIERMGYTNREAARFLGWDEASFSKLVNGARNIGLGKAVKIEQLTGIPARTWVPTETDKDVSNSSAQAEYRAV